MPLVAAEEHRQDPTSKLPAKAAGARRSFAYTTRLTCAVQPLSAVLTSSPSRKAVAAPFGLSVSTLHIAYNAFPVPTP